MIEMTSFRALKRTPVFAVTMVVTLALGIAAAGTMFTMVYGVLLSPLPYGAPDRLASVSLSSPGIPDLRTPPAIQVIYQEHARLIDGFGLYRNGNANIWVPDSGEVSERVTATWLSASMIPMLGVPPLLGRGFTEEDEAQGGSSSVILSESEWRMRFGGRDDVIGKKLMVNSVAREIIGVMPERFTFPVEGTRLWLPVKESKDSSVSDFSYDGIARLRDGVTPGQAQREFAGVLPRITDQFPKLKTGEPTRSWLETARPSPVVTPLRDEMTQSISKVLWILAAAAGLVLLVAWTNAANLMMIRADSSHHELAVREVLGASRLRVATHFLGELLVLGGVSGVAGLAMTWATVRALVALGVLNLPRMENIQIGAPTVAFVMLVTAVSVLICAGVAAARSFRKLPVSLKVGTRSGHMGSAGQRLRSAIAVFQIAIALAASAGSVLLLRTAYNINEVYPGFETENVTTVWTQLPFARYKDASAVAFYAQLAHAARELPSVESAGVASSIPLGSGEIMQQSFRVDGASDGVVLPVNVVDDGYFQSLGIPLLAGRNFRPLDVQQGSDLIISRLAAQSLFGDPRGDASIGRRLTLDPGGPTYVVVGVVGDVRDRDLALAPSPLLYRPQVVPTVVETELPARRSMALVVKSKGPGNLVVPEIRRLVKEIDPTVPVFDIATMDEIVVASTPRLSLTLTLLVAAAVITLVLGAIGLYGVMAYMVVLRTREFGVRSALGAEPARITRLVIVHGMSLAGMGILAGLLIYSLAVPSLKVVLYGVTATDAFSLLGAVSALAIIALLASWFPAKRASRIDPGTALRSE